MHLFTVGPVEMYDEVRRIRADKNSVPYFRTQEFSQLMLDTDLMLRKFAGADETFKTVYLAASGTAAMEATILNCFSKEDSLLIIDGGTFGHRFVEICEIHGIPHEVIKLEFGEILLSHHLENVSDKQYTALLVNLHETSTGQLYDIDLLRRFCKEKDLYLIVDAISAFLCDDFEMSKCGIDAMIISSQKGICVSPGMSMVVMSERLIKECVLTRKTKSMYFDFVAYLDNFKRGQTPFTPAVGVCVEMHESLSLIDKIGVKKHLKRIGDIAKNFRGMITSDAASIPPYPLSNALTPVIFKEPIAHKVFEVLKNKYGMMVNPSGGNLGNHMLRVAHIGNIKLYDNRKLVDCMEKAVTLIKT